MSFIVDAHLAQSGEPTTDYTDHTDWRGFEDGRAAYVLIRAIRVIRGGFSWLTILESDQTHSW